jgi:hypothetical protein
MNYRILLLAPLAAVVLSVGAAAPLRMPTNWYGFQWATPADFRLKVPGSKTYEIGIDPTSDASDMPSLTIRSLVAQIAGPVNLAAAQQVIAGYHGKRVRFSAQVRAEGVRGWGGIYLGPGDLVLMPRISVAEPGIEAELPAGAVVPADGSWHEASVVVDMPDDEDSMNFGLALVGEGQVWARNLQFQVVGPDVAPSKGRLQVDLPTARQRLADHSVVLAKLPPPAREPLKNPTLD